MDHPPPRQDQAERSAGKSTLVIFSLALIFFASYLGQNVWTLLPLAWQKQFDASVSAYSMVIVFAGIFWLTAWILSAYRKRIVEFTVVFMQVCSCYFTFMILLMLLILGSFS